MPAYAAAIPRPPRTLTELEQATLLKVNGKPANMVLDLRVQPGGAADAASLVPYNPRVTVRITEFP